MSLLELSPFPTAAPDTSRILVADDEPAIRSVCRLILEPEGMICDEARDGTEAVEVAASRPYDLVILDVDMPGMKGTEVCRRLRSMPTSPHLKILLVSGHAGDDEMAPMLLAGADDYLAKPFKGVQLRSRVVAALRLKVSQEDSDLINYRLNTLNREMEAELRTRDAGLHHARDTLAASLTRLAQSRDNETGMHMQRLARYSVRLAEEVAGSSGPVATVDREFVERLAWSAPLHDIGKVGVPDAILLKPGKLDPDERRVMESHTIIGFETLRMIAERYDFAGAHLRTAMDVVRHHHERFDGAGYPDRLAGDHIPLSARIVSVCDVYDALRSRRPYKVALAHDDTVFTMSECSEGQFDPEVLDAFRRCAGDFEHIHDGMAD